MSTTSPSRYGRRAFLIRSGVIGAAVALLEGTELLTSVPSGAAGLSAADLAPVFDALATDTINGLVAFVVPGPDPYSLAQGVSDATPGGIAARGTAFMLNALDNFYPVPQEPTRMLLQSLTSALNAYAPQLPALPGATTLAAELDAALAVVLADETTVPLSLLVALLLNFVASLVNPAALNGDFISPFSRLSFAEKTATFSMIEGEAPDLAALLDGDLSEPLKASLSGLIEFLGGALLEFVAFGSYSEFGALDPATRTLVSTPVGWTQSNYLTLAPNHRPVEGWDEFKGYLLGEREASD